MKTIIATVLVTTSLALPSMAMAQPVANTYCCTADAASGVVLDCTWNSAGGGCPVDENQISFSFHAAQGVGGLTTTTNALFINGFCVTPIAMGPSVLVNPEPEVPWCIDFTAFGGFAAEWAYIVFNPQDAITGGVYNYQLCAQGSCTNPTTLSSRTVGGELTLQPLQLAYMGVANCVVSPRCGVNQCNESTDGCGIPYQCQCPDPDNQICTTNGTCCYNATCASTGRQCGTMSDGCGNTVNCGENCGTGYACSASGKCVCQPATCASINGCGTLGDGCGGTLNCGSCANGSICTGNNTCCTPITCAELGSTCGNISDGCGGTLNCGTCSKSEVCGNGQHCVPVPAMPQVASISLMGILALAGVFGIRKRKR